MIGGKRSISVSEEFGVYRVKRDDGSLGVTGRTAEDALVRAFALTPEGCKDVRVHNTSDMGDLVEALLGTKRETETGRVAA